MKISIDADKEIGGEELKKLINLLKELGNVKIVADGNQIVFVSMPEPRKNT